MEDQMSYVVQDTKESNQQIENYFCPNTGAHFEFKDLSKRIKQLQKRRQIIDQAISEEDRMRRR